MHINELNKKELTLKLSFIGLAITFVLVGCGEESTSYSEPSTDGEVSPTEPSNTTSLACINSTLLTPGTTIDLEYASNGAIDFGLNDVHEFVEAVPQYKGFSDVLARKEGQSIVYIKHDKADQSVITLGQTDSEAGMEVDYQPSGLKLNYNLEQGETKHYATVTMIETTAGEMKSYTMDTSLKYVGRETIMVPAGTFETCVFEHKFYVVQDDGISTNTLYTRYTGVDNGIKIKEITETTSSESEDVGLFDDTILLEKGSINGQAIQGL